MRSLQRQTLHPLVGTGIHQIPYWLRFHNPPETLRQTILRDSSVLNILESTLVIRKIQGFPLGFSQQYDNQQHFPEKSIMSKDAGVVAISSTETCKKPELAWRTGFIQRDFSTL